MDIEQVRMKKIVLRPAAIAPTGLAYRIDYASVLNAQQLEAVMHSQGHALVLAGAGTGKTRTLTYRVARLVEDGLGDQRLADIVQERGLGEPVAFAVAEPEAAGEGGVEPGKKPTFGIVWSAAGNANGLRGASATSQLETGTTFTTALSYISAASLALVGSMPPTTFGIRAALKSGLPGSSRSGLYAR